MDEQVLIVGGGLTGLSTALHLPSHVRWSLFEKDARPGGHARTECRDGFYFDKTGHWLHLRDPGMISLVGELFPGGSPERELTKVARKARIFSSGVLTRYPFQANLFGLPPQVISECLLGFIEALSDPRSAEPAKHFADFCDKRFGKGISRHFMLPYNRKLWGVDPAEITAAWCSRFVPIPKLADVVKGAVGDTPPELGYNAHFLYPQTGGIETLVHRIVERLPKDRLHRGAELEQLELRTKTAQIAGERIPYSSLVATLPLPELCRRIVDLPDTLTPWVDKLRCTPVRYLNVATKVPPRSDYHWLYVPEDRYPFYRVGVYSNAVPSMAPSGCGSFYVELSERGVIDVQALLPQVLDALVTAGILHSKEDLLFADLREIDYAYVVFDDNYYPALAALVPFLEANGIYPRGRYGSWTYNSMEDCLMLGRDVAATLAASKLSEQKKS
ncbi:MAG TPA: FAD-dependent oxidoreductase [Pseudomonadota bacterium]|jgi:protoporphyrinogen oxidase|nr:FAD-dependent oxidoreductase [Pseudomonadota bacterium]HNN51359.1 FAD-dependent oxidoreductase [Pseudomonadota bacterium]